MKMNNMDRDYHCIIPRNGKKIFIKVTEMITLEYLSPNYHTKHKQSYTVNLNIINATNYNGALNKFSFSKDPFYTFFFFKSRWHLADFYLNITAYLTLVLGCDIL